MYFLWGRLCPPSYTAFNETWDIHYSSHCLQKKQYTRIEAREQEVMLRLENQAEDSCRHGNVPSKPDQRLQLTQRGNCWPKHMWQNWLNRWALNCLTLNNSAAQEGNISLWGWLHQYGNSSKKRLLLFCPPTQQVRLAALMVLHCCKPEHFNEIKFYNFKTKHERILPQGGMWHQCLLPLHMSVLAGERVPDPGL